jgi:mRNA interferase MazF
VTSRSYGDAGAVQLTNDDFAGGSLRVISYARPAKLFTAHESLFTREVGRLHPAVFEKLRGAVMSVFK